MVAILQTAAFKSDSDIMGEEKRLDFTGVPVQKLGSALPVINLSASISRLCAGRKLKDETRVSVDFQLYIKIARHLPARVFEKQIAKRGLELVPPGSRGN
jgi:hypothetical protein